MAPPRTYLALGDSMSIDLYTGVEGGGAVRQVHRRLEVFGWRLDDRTLDGCVMAEVPTDARGDLVTLTIGGNDLLARQGRWLKEGLEGFEAEHKKLLEAVRATNEAAAFLVANVYRPQAPLSEEQERALEAANALIAESCAAVDAAVIDVAGAFHGREELLLTEQIEPSLAGASVLATLFLLELRRLGLVR
jgi:lysophospholipase L1-like esterase